MLRAIDKASRALREAQGERGFFRPVTNRPLASCGHDLVDHLTNPARWVIYEFGLTSEAQIAIAKLHIAG